MIIAILDGKEAQHLKEGLLEPAERSQALGAERDSQGGAFLLGWLWYRAEGKRGAEK